MINYMGIPDVSICPLARRSLLSGAGAAGILALLAACGDDPPEQAPDAAAGSPTPTEEPTEEPTPDQTSDDSEPDGALVSVEEVPVGGGVIALGDILVVQPRSGVFRAYDAHCPHQATIIDPPDSAGVITCTGHFSHFRASDGSRIDGPAMRGLRQIDVRVTAGYVIRT
ncbi:MAG TPA: Rieske (2Fe-2S) protein [Micromonosporaceae bacterium]|nr:Rieske (2Fe-2S) protein [Micromonosporaceae bacterium]